MKSSVQTAREQGYSDEEISSFLEKKDPSLSEKFKKGIDSGYSHEELLNHYEESNQYWS